MTTRRRTAALFGLALAFAACGRDAGVSSEQTSSAEMCAETGPNNVGEAEGQRISRSQNELRGDIEKVGRYGDAHADEFTSYGFVNEPTVGIFAYFATNLDEHDAALRGQLDHPDALDVRQGVQSKEKIDALMKSMTEINHAGPRSNGAVHADFNSTRAGRTAAEALHEKAGDVTCVSIGGHPYPKGIRPDTDMCDEFPKEAPNPDVEVQLILDSPTIARGEVGKGIARLTNKSATPITTDTNGQLYAVVVLPGTTTIVGHEGNKFRELPLLQFTANPGESVDIPIRFGTDDCRKDSDYALPAGTYSVALTAPRSAEATLTVVDD